MTIEFQKGEFQTEAAKMSSLVMTN